MNFVQKNTRPKYKILKRTNTYTKKITYEPKVLYLYIFNIPLIEISLIDKTYGTYCKTIEEARDLIDFHKAKIIKEVVEYIK